MISRCNLRLLRVAASAAATALVATACMDATAPHDRVHERWYQTQLGNGYSRPVVVGNTVYFSAGDGWMIAYYAQSGVVRWRRKLGNEEIAGLNFVERKGVVVVVFLYSTIGVDAASGQELWRYYAPPDTVLRGGSGTPGYVNWTHVAADDQTVYVPAWGASVGASDVATGAIRWTWQFGPTVTDTAARGVFRSGSNGVAVSGDTVFATVWHGRDAALLSSDCWLVALDRSTGRELWTVALPLLGSGVSIGSSPAFARNLVIVSTWGGYVFAIDRNSRQIAWEFRPPISYFSAAQAEVSEGVVYDDAGDGNFYALDATDGRVIWRSHVGSMSTRDMLITGRRVLFSDGTSLHVLDRLTGRQVVEVVQPRTWDSFFSSAPAYANGQIFVTVGDAAWSFDEP